MRQQSGRRGFLHINPPKMRIGKNDWIRWQGHVTTPARHVRRVATGSCHAPLLPEHFRIDA